MRVGLRIDVDTLRGARRGVPGLCRILDERSVRASFFFSVGPDNMGRHLWRLARPAFAWKMLRSGAPTLYGWDVALKGTLWPGPRIGVRAGDAIRAAAAAGHEIGLHAWDHHGWQANVDRMTVQDVRGVLARGVEELERIVGTPPTCFAAPGWRCNARVLRAESAFPFAFASDCRGDSVFVPVAAGRKSSQPQVPVTLPTYDELVGRNGIRRGNYNDHLLSRLDPDGLNVLAIHAEVEGISCARMFEQFLDAAEERGVSFVPLGELLPEGEAIPADAIASHEIPGRDGPVACQAGWLGRSEA